MQETILTIPALEEFYQKVILPQFDVEKKMDNVVWVGHSTIGPDADAHHFRIGQKEYALIFEDYPGLGDEGIQEEVAASWQRIVRIGLTGHDDASTKVLSFGPAELPSKYVHNVTGYFSLVEIVG